jgi:septum formation protein
MLHLASKSPRRRELLLRHGFTFGLLDMEIPEHPAPEEAPDDYVRRVAREKAGAGLLRVIGQADAVVLGADTEVVLDGRVFGKPADAEDAAAMLRALAGRTHRVMSSVAVVSAAREAQATSITEVSFAPLDEAQIAEYLASGEWVGKAGAYAIQGCRGVRGASFGQLLGSDGAADVRNHGVVARFRPARRPQIRSEARA